MYQTAASSHLSLYTHMIHSNSKAETKEHRGTSPSPSGNIICEKSKFFLFWFVEALIKHWYSRFFSSQNSSLDALMPDILLQRNKAFPSATEVKTWNENGLRENSTLVKSSDASWEASFDTGRMTVNRLPLTTQVLLRQTQASKWECSPLAVPEREGPQAWAELKGVWLEDMRGQLQEEAE